MCVCVGTNGILRGANSISRNEITPPQNLCCQTPTRNVTVNTPQFAMLGTPSLTCRSPISWMRKSLSFGCSSSSNLSRSGSNFLKISACTPDFPLASRLVVKNLSYLTGEIILKKEFSKFGEVAEVKLIKDADGKRSKGYAFIQFTSQDDAMLALENMDHKWIDGRMVYVELAKIEKNATWLYPRSSGPPTGENS